MMAKRKKKRPRTKAPVEKPQVGSLPPDWRTASGQSSPDADALPRVRAAMFQIDRLLGLMPPEIVVQSSAPQDGRELHNWDVVGPAMLFSAANCLLSLRWLAETPAPRREQDASILLRRLYEHVVCFAWIAIDPSVNAKRWVAYDYGYRLKADAELKNLGKRGLDPAIRSAFEAFLATTPNMPPVPQRAREADAHWLPKLAHHAAKHAPGRHKSERVFSLADEYTSIYRPTSANTHPTPQSLFEYVNPGFAKGRFRIGMVPTLSDRDRYAYTLAPLVFATLLLISEQALGYPRADAIFASFLQSPSATPGGAQ